MSLNQNLVIGGDFTTNPWSREVTFAGSAAHYNADGWYFNANYPSYPITVSKSTDVPSFATAGFNVGNSMLIECTTAVTSIPSSQILNLRHQVEGYDWARFYGENHTVSFYIKSNVTGTMSYSQVNYGLDRSIVSEISIPTANVWQKVTISLPGNPNSGTWNLADNTGCYMQWVLQCGTDYKTGTLNTWQTTAGPNPKVASNNQTNFLGTVGNKIWIALVKSELGSSATPWVAETPAETLVKTGRFLQKSYNHGVYPGQGSVSGAERSRVGSAVSNGSIIEMRRLPQRLSRDGQTITLYSPETGASGKIRNYSAGSDISVTVSNVTDSSFSLINASGSSISAGSELAYHWLADGSLNV